MSGIGILDLLQDPTVAPSTLQEGEFKRFGSSVTRKVDVRVIAASNRDLQAAVREGAFRADLYYRLRVFPIEIPPLRLRKDDIPLLVWFFLNELGLALGKKIERVSPAAMQRLVAYDWPGNVRELRKVLERAVILCRGLCWRWRNRSRRAGGAPGCLPVPARAGRLSTSSENTSSASWSSAPGGSGGRGTPRSALGLNASTLYSRMKKLRIRRDGAGPAPSAVDSLRLT